MNEGAGVELYDISQNEAIGTVTNFNSSGIPTWAPGNFGSGVNFFNTGTEYGNQYPWISIPAVVLGTVHTTVAWINPQGQGGAVSFGALNGDNNSTNNISTLFVSGDPVGTLGYSMATGGASVGIPPIANSWHQLVSVRNGTNVNLYLDGQFVGNANLPANTAANIVQIGSRENRYPFSLSFNGTIDHQLFYNRALSAGEIQQLYTDPFCFMQKRQQPLFAPSGAPPVNPGYVYIGGWL
jgi:hypothetical protein